MNKQNNHKEKPCFLQWLLALSGQANSIKLRLFFGWTNASDVGPFHKDQEINIRGYQAIRYPRNFVSQQEEETFK